MTPKRVRNPSKIASAAEPALREEQQSALVETIGDASADQRKQEKCQSLRQRDGAQGECRSVGDLQNQQALGDDLHPGADRRNGQAEPEQPEVAMPQRAKCLEHTGILQVGLRSGRGGYDPHPALIRYDQATGAASDFAAARAASIR